MITFNLSLPQYLRQWLAHQCGSPEGQPVQFPKGSPLNAFLRVFIRNKRERETFEPHDEDSVKIVVPRFPGKDPAYHNYLPPRALRDLAELVRDCFDADLFKDMSQFHIQCQPKRRNALLELWMEEHGIDVTDRAFNAVNKRLQLLRSRAFDRERHKAAYHAKNKAQ